MLIITTVGPAPSLLPWWRPASPSFQGGSTFPLYQPNVLAEVYNPRQNIVALLQYPGQMLQDQGKLVVSIHLRTLVYVSGQIWRDKKSIIVQDLLAEDFIGTFHALLRGWVPGPKIPLFDLLPWVLAWTSQKAKQPIQLFLMKETQADFGPATQSPGPIKSPR